MGRVLRPKYTQPASRLARLRLCIGALISVAFVASCNRAPPPSVEEYLAQLDRWVEQGGPTENIQADIVEPCGRLLMAYSPAEDRAQFIAERRDAAEGAYTDWDFWVDMCVKMTAHRLTPQPEFEGPEKAELVRQTCESHEMWERLCDRAELGI